MYKASVIIPVYNAEKYLNSTIESLLAQSYTDFEIVLVNDGSTDGSERLLNRYKQYGDRFNCITKENGGIASARNKGLELAKGEFIFFMDNDDLVEKDYIQVYLDEAEKSGADMVVGGFTRRTVTGEVEYRFELADTPWSPFRIQTPWARCYRSEFIKKWNLKFFDTKLGEDASFNIPANLVAKKISILPYCGYSWIDRKNSASNTTQKNSSHYIDVIEMLKFIYHSTKYEELSTEQKEMLEYFTVKYTIWYLLYIGRHDEKIYRALFKNLAELFPNWQKNSLIRLSYPKGESLKVRLAVTLATKAHSVGLDRLIYSISNILHS